MEKNCKSCKNSLTLEIWDYNTPKVPRMALPGFVCTLFAPDGICSYMLGVDKEEALCECYQEREKK